MNIIRKARGTEIQRKQQQVFLCWHPGDIEKRDMLVKDLLSFNAGADCVVSWLEDPTGDINETLLRQELQETQLFVFLVTLTFLQQNEDEDMAEFRIAKELSDLPKLPVATETGLFPRAIKLLEDAPSGLESRAINQLAEIYENGIQVDVDFEKALAWCEKYLRLCKALFGESEYTSIAYSLCSSTYMSLGDYNKALELELEALKIDESTLGLEHPNI